MRDERTIMEKFDVTNYALNKSIVSKIWNQNALININTMGLSKRENICVKCRFQKHFKKSNVKKKSSSISWASDWHYLNISLSNMALPWRGDRPLSKAIATNTTHRLIITAAQCVNEVLMILTLSLINLQCWSLLVDGHKLLSSNRGLF